MKFRWTCIACIALLTSCGKDIPSKIIQPEEMEKVLYDYHLWMGMSNDMRNTEREAHKNYIFRKHGITEAEFDSSMVWYTRESKELMSIYENLNKRFNREHSQIERLLESRNETNTRMSLSGDSVDIWRKGDIQWLAQTPLHKQLTFEIISDTTFHERDAFLWDMRYEFLSPGKAIMGMSVIYDNDSVIGVTKEVTESGPQDIYIHTDSAFKIKALNGFVYVPNDSTLNPNILLHKIKLHRYHMPAPDSLAIDSTLVGKEEVEVKEVKKEKEVKEIQKPVQKKEVKKRPSRKKDLTPKPADKIKPQNTQMQKIEIAK